ncbi:MAG: hypothetical protein JXN62_03455 [Bacteroidales bacterium]|nr:hypothetical protein [Bacteroidales bacterium]
MKKIAVFTTLLIISFMNLKMRMADDTAKLKGEISSSEKSISPGNYPSCIPNPSQSEGGWNGTLNLEYTTQFDCTYNDGTIHETENLAQNLSLNLTVDVIDFGKGMVARIIGVTANGSIDVKYSLRHEETRKEYHKLKTIDCDDSFSATEECLGGLIIQKKIGNDPKAIQEKMQKIIQEGDLNKIVKEVESMNKQDQGGGLEIEVVIQLFAPGTSDVTIREFISSDQEKKDNTWSEKMTIAIPLQVHLEGSMSTGEDGSGTIVASFTGKEDLPNGKPSSFGCPPIISIKNCTLTLSK